MSKVYILLADGFEEIEGLTVVDLLRRSGIDIEMVSIKDELNITGARGIKVIADKLITDITDKADMLVLPGGMPGTNYLKQSEAVKKMVMDYLNDDKYIAAICAAPTIFGEMGLLNGKKATCYPGLEPSLTGAMWPGESDPVVRDGKIITSRGLGTAIDFALEIIRVLINDIKAEEIAKSIVYKI